MALALTVDSLDSVPEALRTEYTEKDGKFHLNVDGLEDTSGLKSALQKTRAERDAIAKASKAYEKLGKSPDEIADLLAAREKEAEEALKKAGKFDEVLAQHLGKAEQARKELESKLTGERDTALSVARKAIVDTRIGGALAKVRATAAGLDLLTERLGKRVQLDLADGKEVVSILQADGTPMVGSGKDGLATFDDLVKEAVKNYPELFEGTGAGGTGTDPKSRRDAGAKTLTRKEFDELDPVARATKMKEGFKVTD